MVIGERIRKLREEQGWSQSELARKTGIKREYISKLESGTLPNPTYFTMQKLARGLGVNVSDLTDDDIYSITALARQREKQHHEVLGALREMIAQLQHKVAILEISQHQVPEKPPCTKP